jgi:uridine kinase
MYVIGIAGGSGSGKTTLVESILSRIPREEISILPQDAYYRDNSHIPLEDRFKLNYDHPNSIEWELMLKDIQTLKTGKAIAHPTYSYLTCTRLPETVPVQPKNILLIEGILIYTSLEMCKELDMRIFLEVPADQRLTRIIQRDMASRGRTALEVIDRYYKTVRPMHEDYIEPSRQQADMLVMGGGLNEQAAEFIASAILQKLR